MSWRVRAGSPVATSSGPKHSSQTVSGSTGYCWPQIRHCSAAGDETASQGVFLDCWTRKEALLKALGTGFRSGVYWRDLGVVNTPSGKPTVLMTNGAADRLKALTPPGMVAQVDLTITDEYPMAQAIVIISAVPASLP